MKISKLTLTVQSMIICVPTVVLAQEAPESGRMMLEEVVVTGTPGGGEMRKLDASFAITNVDDEDIRRFSPKSTADLLKTVPGVWAESSGGVAGANVFVRGFPGTGDAPFLTLQLEGAPVYPPATLAFLENTTLFRIDETVERMEGLRGGPQSVQDNGQPGLTTNFLLKRGGEETEGTVKYSTSDYDLQRFDAVMSGPLGDDLYYMVGGYVTSSPGIRDAGYSAEKGSQFTVKLTKELDNGTVSVYHRNTDDHGTWYLPGALNVPGVDNEYTQVGTLNRKGTIRVGPDGETRSVDLGDGRGWDGSVTGLNFDLEISEHWSLSDSLNFTAGNADTVGLVPQSPAVNVGALLADPSLDEAAVVTGALTGTATGRAIDSAEFIQQFGLWEVRKEIESFTNNLALTGSYDRFDVTVGAYTATASVDDMWSLDNTKYHVVERGGERIDGIACNAVTVDSCGGNFDLDADGDATSTAFYATASYRFIDPLLVDVGVRQETHEVDYSADEGIDGSIDKVVRYDENETSFTVGANLDVGDNQGVFARFSQGYKFPTFDNLRDNFEGFQNGGDLIQEITQFELGYKAGFDNLSAYLTLFGNESDDIGSVTRPGAPPDQQSFEAVGLEVDVQWFHDSGFSLGVNATIQETEITDSPTDPEFEGNEAQRQPPWQVRLSPSYDIDFGNGMAATIYGAFTAVDDRFADNGNTVTLDGYEKLDLGIIFNASDNLAIQFSADNVTDEDGLTEGDPRDPTSPNGRFILPRSYKVSVGYDF